MRKFIRVRRLVSLALVLTILLALSGCWDYRGLNNLVFVSGIAVDKNPETGDYIVTFEIMRLQENIKQEGLSSTIVESTGRTIPEAVRNANRRVTYRLYFGHSTVLIISEQLAIDGEVEQILDWVLRESEMRETASIVVSVGQPAGDILKLKGLDQSVVANEINRILKEDDKTASLTYNVAAYEAYNLLNAEGESLVLPIFHAAYNDGEMVVESNGLAVFKDTVMLGTLSPLESKMFLFLIDEMHGGTLICGLPEKKGMYFTLAVSKSDTKIDYERGADGQFTFFIKIKLSTSLTQTDKSADMLKEDIISDFERYAEEQLKGDIEEAVQRVQREYASDIFGLGNYIHDTNYSLWREIKDSWDEFFHNARVIAEPDISITNTEYQKS
ncbi:MAG TPA: Ger(x)C family spore germination protein [Clostridia bacterium]|nr:Ger(x)C family spore germination protein [Clostridia bacterium]